MSVLSSILGMVVLIAIAVLLSNNRKAISIRTVVGALAIQVGFAALILYVPAGKQALGAAADMVSMLLPMVMTGLISFSADWQIQVNHPVSFCSESITDYRILLWLNFCALLSRHYASRD